MKYNTISKMFLNTVEQFAHNHILYYKCKNEWIGLTGKDIEVTVNDISFALKSIGIDAGNKIAILSNNSPRWAMTDYGIICSGAATVSVYPTLIDKQVEYILKDSGSKVAFVEDKEQFDKVNNVWSNCPDLDLVVVMDDSDQSDDKRVINFKEMLDKGTEYAKTYGKTLKELVEDANPEDLLTLIYTSGTTGTPKGVMLTHQNLVSNMLDILDKISITSKDTLLSFLPLSHVFERMSGHFTAFSKGAKIYYAESIETVPQNMTEVKPTLMISVPRLYDKMYAKVLDGIKSAPSIKQKLFWWALGVGTKVSTLKLAKNSIPFMLNKKFGLANKLVFSKIKEKVGGRLRFFVSGGAPLSKEVAEFFSAANITILEGYGLTETSPILTANTEEEIRFGTVGKAMSSVDIKIADDGEILAKGPNIMKGYYKSPEATKEVIDKDGWFHTGDIGEFDEEGFLKITDRKKNILITSGGKNVAPAPIENSILNSVYIDQIIIIGDKRKFLSALVVPAFESVVKYLESKDISLTDNNAIIEHSAARELINSEIEKGMQNFSDYEKVKHFELLSEPFTIESGELTPTLKVVRKVVESNHDELIENIYNN